MSNCRTCAYAKRRRWRVGLDSAKACWLWPWEVRALGDELLGSLFISNKTIWYHRCWKLFSRWECSVSMRRVLDCFYSVVGYKRSRGPDSRGTWKVHSMHLCILRYDLWILKHVSSRPIWSFAQLQEASLFYTFFRCTEAVFGDLKESVEKGSTKLLLVLCGITSYADDVWILWSFQTAKLNSWKHPGPLPIWVLGWFADAQTRRRVWKVSPGPIPFPFRSSKRFQVYWKVPSMKGSKIKFQKRFQVKGFNKITPGVRVPRRVSKSFKSRFQTPGGCKARLFCYKKHMKAKNHSRWLPSNHFLRHDSVAGADPPQPGLGTFVGRVGQAESWGSSAALWELHRDSKFQVPKSRV